MTPKEKAEQLFGKIDEHTEYWDYYNDEPLEYDHTKKVVLLLVYEILETNLNSKDKLYWNKVLHFVKNSHTLNW